MKAFIFDMDGILFDTEYLVQEALRAVSKRHGERTDIDEFYPTTCGSTIATANLLYTSFFGSEYPYEERRAEMRRWVAEKIANDGIPIKDGALSLLKFLKEKGYKIALATSTSRASAESHLKSAGFSDFFDASVCGDEIKNAKPNPEVFLKAAEKLGVIPSECYVAEDSYVGVEAAFKAGMKVFMIPDMNPPRDKEKELSYKICDSLFDVIEYL